MMDQSSPPTDSQRAAIASQLGFPAALEGARIFLTGGTGFIGSALLRSYAALRSSLGWKAEIVLLSRTPSAISEFAKENLVQVVPGGLLDFRFPPGEFSHVIHCAAPTDTAFFRSHPEETFSQIVDGTKRMLDFSASASGQRFLYLSSGAVYGPVFSPGAVKSRETDPLLADKDLTSHAYALGKIAAEKLLLQQGQPFAGMSARCFAFSGEGLPWDKHYAIGNFVRDAAAGGPIRVTGDGSAVRSYLDSQDLAFWLWSLLAKGRVGEAYNVGSENPVSIRELATLVGKISGCSVQISAPVEKPALLNSYLPSTEKARGELGLAEWVSLESSIKAMLAKPKL